MTYRNKLMLRRLLIGLAIAAAAVFLLLLISFTYLGRYVVYTEDGAYFSFNAPESEASHTEEAAALSAVEIITGAPISANEVIGDAHTQLKDTEVRGILVDYATLQSGQSMGNVELGGDSHNTLILEMRTTRQNMLDNQTVTKLIRRAKAQDVWLAAIVSCLSDNQYALDHPELALRIDGGAYWVSSEGSYWLDPSNPDTIAYVTDLIRQLAEMGFDEVILTDFYMPSSSSVVYDFGGESAADIGEEAYFQLLEKTVDLCKLGLLIKDPYEGHQLYSVADRVYVCYEEGSTVRSYAEEHADQYLVFITTSHDTRFDGYGKVEAGESFTQEAEPENEGTAVRDYSDEEDQDREEEEVPGEDEDDEE